MFIVTLASPEKVQEFRIENKELGEQVFLILANLLYLIKKSREV